MPSSTWRREFEAHKRPRTRLALLVAGAIAGPLAWLTSLQAAYALNYPACWTGHRSLLVAVVVLPIPLCLFLAVRLYRGERPGAEHPAELPWPIWTASLGILTCLFFIIVALAMLVPIIGLDPCQ
jgi:hypothetical protein